MKNEGSKIGDLLPRGMKELISTSDCVTKKKKQTDKQSEFAYLSKNFLLNPIED